MREPAPRVCPLPLSGSVAPSARQCQVRPPSAERGKHHTSNGRTIPPTAKVTTPSRHRPTSGALPRRECDCGEPTSIPGSCCRGAGSSDLFWRCRSNRLIVHDTDRSGEPASVARMTLGSVGDGERWTSEVIDGGMPPHKTIRHVEFADGELRLTTQIFRGRRSNACLTNADSSESTCRFEVDRLHDSRCDFSGLPPHGCRLQNSVRVHHRPDGGDAPRCAILIEFTRRTGHRVRHQID